MNKEKEKDTIIEITPMKKITMAKIGLTKACLTELAMKHKTEKFIPISQVVGVVQGAKPEESDDGKQSWLRLRGSFKAVNLLTGEENRSATCILPEVAEGVAAAGIASGADASEFAVIIGIQYEETAATMYEFRCKSYQKGTNEMFERLEAQMPKVKLLK